MDPYEPLPIDNAAAGAKKPRFQWKAIVAAFLLQLAVSIFMIALLNRATHIPELIFLGISFGIPYVCGAAYLSYRVKSNWIRQGLVYTLVCPVLFFSSKGSLSPSSISDVIVWELFTVLLTLLTMAITRMLMANRPA